VREELAEAMKAPFLELKKAGTSRPLAAIERYIFPEASSQAAPAPRAQVTSPALTPALTMESNTPESSSPPSTHASVGETGEEATKESDNTPSGASTVVQVQEV